MNQSPSQPEPSVARMEFDPELKLARFLPRTTVLPWNLKLIRALGKLAPARPAARVQTLRVDENVSLRLHRPDTPPSDTEPIPAMLWIHGGGFVIGTASQDDRLCHRFARELGIVVASVEYRLAPEFPFPTPVEDCYEALRWLASQPYVRGDRVAVGGASAGGGLAAAVAIMARDRAEVRLSAQALAYPMLDDRTTNRTDVDAKSLRMWNQRSNQFGWRAYLGPAYGDAVPPLAAPSRCDDLGGLPPTWIGVGTNDLFHDEDVAFARRLKKSGVPCELHVVQGAYHGFDMVEPKASISKTFHASCSEALGRALNGAAPTNG